jgi:hypothetical protein
MRAVRGRWTIVAALAVAALAGCSSDATKPRSIGVADAYVAIVGWELGQIGPPPSSGALPVVYVASEDGTTIDAGAQAKVVQATVDTAKVRFTDVRDDAIDKNVAGAPVKDGGVMLIVDKFDGKGRSNLDVPITVYTTKADQQHVTLTLIATAQGATVTSAQRAPVTSASPPPSG